MSRITIELTSSEMEALKQNARRDLRQPREQARHILRNALLATNSQGTHADQFTQLPTGTTPDDI